MTHHAFLGSGELMVIALVGLLVFGRQLPEVMREAGKLWFRLRRTINDLKRETGFDEAIRDIRREANPDIGLRDLRRQMDPFAGPAKDEPAEDTVLDPGPTAKRTPPGALSQDEEPSSAVETPEGPNEEAKEET